MELQRCPFCEDEEIYTFHYKAEKVKLDSFLNSKEWRDCFGVGCNGCGIEITNTWETEEEAAKAWNTRVSLSGIEEHL